MFKPLLLWVSLIYGQTWPWLTAQGANEEGVWECPQWWWYTMVEIVRGFLIGSDVSVESSGAQGPDSKSESLGVVLREHHPKSTVKAYSMRRLVPSNILSPPSIMPPEPWRGRCSSLIMTGHSTVIYSLYVDHLGVSTVTADHHHNKLLWPQLKAALFYGHKYLEGNLIDTACPFSQTAAAVSPLEVIGLLTGFTVLDMNSFLFTIHQI